MINAYARLESRNPDSPLLRLMQVGEEEWVLTNEFSARYSPERYIQMAQAYAAYTADLETALQKSMNAFG